MTSANHDAVAVVESDQPEGWMLTCFSEVCQINPPKAPPDALEPDQPVTFVPMPAVDADTGTIATPQERPFSEVRRGFTSFQDDDVIMAKITPCMENGKAAIARSLTNGLGFGSTEFHVIRSNGAVLPEYVYFFIRQESFRRAAEAEMTGSVGQKRVPQTFLEATELPLPPKDEQERIVEKVEQLLTRVNAARERLVRVPAILKRFRQAVLAAACSGHLTADWREARPRPDSTGEKLLEEISRKREDQWIVENRHTTKAGRYMKPARANPEFEAEIPVGWSLASVDELSNRITSGSRDWKRYYRDNGPGTFIMAQNVRPLRFDQSYRLAIDPPTNDRDRERSAVRQDDILVTIVGANTGDICRVTVQVKQHYVCQSVALIRPVMSEVSAFLELYLNSPLHGQAQYQNWIYGEGRPHLSFDHLRETAVLLPPLEEQHEIVRRVQAQFKLADAIEKRVAAATAGAEKLTQAILAKAFRGELVPTEAELARREGRSYEPASALLARVHAQRASSEKNRPSHRQGRPVRSRQLTPRST